MPKSTKAIKVTDKEKAWNKKERPSSYRIDSIPIKKTILIICEGQTEAMYFKSFPVVTEFRVETVDMKGQSKVKLVESAQEIIDLNNIQFDEVWCVFDMDVKRGAKEFADFDNAIYRALSLGYKVGYSNDAFELWFYLHFFFTDIQNLRTFYYTELGKLFGINYIKIGKKYDFCIKLYEILNTIDDSSQQNAIERARLLYENQAHLPYHQQNPNTKVYELVEELNRNLRR